MKKTPIILTIALLAAAVLAPCTAGAWTSVRTGQKNFERAWSAYVFRRPDMAAKYFARAADAFGAGLAEDPPSRTTMFPSNLTMAGMSLYYAGRYQEVAAPMEKVMAKDDRIWEAPLYAALASARLGDAAGTIRLFKLYLESSPTQSILSGVVKRQLDALETGSPSLADVVAAVEQAAFDQFDANINQSIGRTSNAQDECDGIYWWRFNRSPCAERFKFAS
jgi:tetratricopeptide (TPR) repeat protein